jgi:transcription initiation factor TFIIE subunit beta
MKYIFFILRGRLCLSSHIRLHIDLAFDIVQSKHDLKGKDQLLHLIRRFPEGLPVVEVKDSYPTVLDDLQVTKLFLV